MSGACNAFRKDKKDVPDFAGETLREETSGRRVGIG
jgi:hypothetical protein